MVRFIMADFMVTADITEVKHDILTSFRIKKSKLYNFSLIMRERVCVQ